MTTQEDRARQYAEKLSEMIRVPTVGSYTLSDGEIARFRDFHALLRKLFPHVFGVCEFEDFNGSFLLRWKGRGTARPILLMNHLDVVEAGGIWEHPPFAGEIADGRIWGRGTVDTKSGLMCMLQAAEELIADGFVPEQDIYFESACTEECSGAGADTISAELEKRGVRFSFSLDEGGLIVSNPLGGDGRFCMVAIAEKGCADIRFTARSAGGHASRPGKNTPLIRLSKFMLAVERSRRFPVHCGDVVKEMLRRLSQKSDGAVRLLLSRPQHRGWLLARLLPLFSASVGSMMKTTVAFTMAGGSEAANILPQEAWIMANVRYSHYQGQENSLAVLQKIADRCGVEMRVMDPGFMSRLSDFRSDSFRLMESAIAAVFPEAPAVPYISSSASDNRFMSRVADNCYGFAPFVVSDEQLDSIHGLNENLDIAALPPAVDFYQYVMKEGHFHG